ncbi:threonine-phosphate decarboxylase [Planococcus sp. ISL-109]|uniref:pyridoxal phosphate-dependent aminotransferase n=1 Tax=Planococcus sp. ISL-109 TaxID=2819166 RepID=UPI001BE62AE3|nr:threonine-phosphate decarboxylase [Planococcus sp. ISL-109]MBT2583029.1 pyridoxal phosphate-dependent class II aminotransferase [Planococcus sp. ISL-109]
MKLPEHGANPHRLYKEAGQREPADIIDFSENVHPFGPPAFVKQQWPDFFGLLTAYPDPEAEPFRTAAAQYHGVEKAQVAAGNGAAEIFTWLAKRYRNKRVLLVEPAFSEYRSTLESENAQIVEINLQQSNAWKLKIEEVKKNIGGCDALYVCNPHNPTGRLLEINELAEIAELCRGVCELVIDEAFIDFVGEHASFIPWLKDYPHVIIARSMTKMYALAGLRLGYVVADSPVIRQLTEGAAHWNVNGLAAVAGARCFSEEAYRVQVMEAASKERKKMEGFLTEAGCVFIPSAANFLCFRLPDPSKSEQFFRAMLEAGIVLRHTYSFRGMDGEWFRIGMKRAAAMERLRKEMHQWLTN